jgi:hypothetical protein
LQKCGVLLYGLSARRISMRIVGAILLGFGLFVSNAYGLTVTRAVIEGGMLELGPFYSIHPDCS